ncbi:MAG: sensor signal transduction histidine kinase [Alphaproteobacteria bacterium]|nr:sensor signal transduction histidine kinase [Alphaproteobacteria bacterium]
MSSVSAVRQQGVIDGLRVDNADLSRVIAENSRLQADRLYLASMVETSNDAIISMDMMGLVTSWNRAAWCLFGYEKPEIIGQPVTPLFPPDRLDEEDEIRSRIRNGEVVGQYETVRLHKDGSELQVSLMASPIVSAEGEIIGISKIIHDISAQRHAQEELRTLQAELVHLSRWNMMGMMASSLAHELNQPLTAMLNYVRAARRTMGTTAADTRAGEFLDKAITETKLAGGIIRSLREFIDKRETTRKPEDIGNVLEDSLTLSLYVGAEGRDKIETRFAPGLPLVMIDKVQIQQVLLNLVRNALEAMKDMPDGRLVIAAGTDEPGFIAVSVSDTGPGLAPEVAGRLFQPFTTTKETGMGVGLSICQSIVESHGGKIWSTPNTPQGVIFHFKLPVAEDQHAA